MDSNYSFSILFNNQQGIVIRIALILERRGFTIQSLNIKESCISRNYEMLLQICGPEGKVEQVQKQLSKLIDVILVEINESKFHYNLEGLTLI